MPMSCDQDLWLASKRAVTFVRTTWEAIARRGRDIRRTVCCDTRTHARLATLSP
jgi:hypothetical protein